MFKAIVAVALGLTVIPANANDSTGVMTLSQYERIKKLYKGKDSPEIVFYVKASLDTAMLYNAYTVSTFGSQKLFCVKDRIGFDDAEKMIEAKIGYIDFSSADAANDKTKIAIPLVILEGLIRRHPCDKK